MKKTFMRLSAFVAAAMVVFAACEPADPETENGGLKDENSEQTGGNGNGNEGGNENEGGNNNEGGNTGGTPDASASLQGSAYVPVSLDAVSTEEIADKIVTNLTVNDQTIFLYLWDGTYIGGNSSGLNFYGDAAVWTSIVSAGLGWTGGGFCIADTAPVAGFCQTADLENWYFHFAYKQTKANVPQLMTIIWASKEYKFAYGADYIEYSSSGDGSIVAQHTAIAPVSGEFKLGEWNEYEICLADMGIDFSQTSSGNYLVVNTEATIGNTLDLDAVFFYKK